MARQEPSARRGVQALEAPWAWAGSVRAEPTRAGPWAWAGPACGSRCRRGGGGNHAGNRDDRVIPGAWGRERAADDVGGFPPARREQLWRSDVVNPGSLHSARG